jgi:adenine phosphoribosyltransferase
MAASFILYQNVYLLLHFSYFSVQLHKLLYSTNETFFEKEKKNMTMTMKKIADELHDHDFHGVQFWDFNSLTNDPEKWKCLISDIANQYRDQDIDMIIGLDARGFLISGALSLALGIGSVTARKPGKLPGETVSIKYGKEYSAVDENGNETMEQDELHLQREHIRPGMRVLITDDVLATGGTAEACCALVEMLGAQVVGIAVAIEIPFLAGRSKLMQYCVSSEMSVIDDKIKSNEFVRYCVDPIIHDADTHDLLLIDRLSEPRGLAMAGGGIESGESVIDAMIREVFEELGLVVSPNQIRFTTVLAGADRDPRGDQVSYVCEMNICTHGVRGEKEKTIPHFIPPAEVQTIDDDVFAFSDHQTVLLAVAAT